MLGFAPIGSAPIASVLGGLTTVSEALSASGGITFGGSAGLGLVAPLSSSGGLVFGGAPSLFTDVYTGSSGGLTFGGSPLLRVAGKPYLFNAVPEAFVFRADKVAFEFHSLPDRFLFRGSR